MYYASLITIADPLRVGNKAANLSTLHANGIPVPVGFAVTCDGLQLLLTESALDATIDAYLNFSADTPRAERQQQYTHICEQVMAAPLPQVLREDITPPLLAMLQNAPYGLAVRTSGVQEDTGDVGFAGIYASFLGITTEDAFWQAVRQCWCSCWSPLACDYMHRMGMMPLPAQMAVLVQPMIPAESAGVIYTADPKTGDPWCFVTHSAFGLARDLLSGGVDGDTSVLAWKSGEVIEQSLVPKPTALIAAPSGTEVHQIDHSRQHLPSLNPTDARKLGQLALRIDNLFDRRMDIEWVFADGEFTIVQARPLTALPEFFPVTLSAEEATWTWTRETASTQFNCMDADNRLVAPLFKDYWNSEDWQGAQPLDRTIGMPVGAIERDFNGHRYQVDCIFQRHFWHAFPGGGDEMISWFEENEVIYREKWEANKRLLHATAREIQQALARTRTAKELIPTTLQMLQRNHEEFHRQAFSASQFFGWMTGSMLHHFLSRFGTDYPGDDLQLGLDTFTYRRAVAAQQLGRNIHEAPVRAAFTELPIDQVMPHLIEQQRGCHFLQEYGDFCAQFGYTPLHWYGRPTSWTFTAPTDILGIIRGTMLGSVPDAREEHLAFMRTRFQAEDALREMIRQQEPTQVPRFERVLRWAQYWQPVLNERAIDGVAQTWIWELLWETGLRLVREGLLEEAREIYLLTQQDLSEIAGLDRVFRFRRQFVKNKQEYERNRRLTPPKYLGTLPETSNAPAPGNITIAPEPGNIFHGRGITGWQMIGLARKTRNVKDAGLFDTLTNDDVLVCNGHSLDYYNDWHSIFLIVKSLVICGRFSGQHHANQISRECGVAFVILGEECYDAIPDRCRLAVDGKAGTVTIFEE